LYDNFTLPIWKHLNDLFGFCAKNYFLVTAHHTIIFPLHISQLFVYPKSNNYFTTGNRLNICLLCIESLYDNFKSPIWKRFNHLYGYCAKQNFLATAHLSFCYCASPNYLSSSNRPIISPLEIVSIFDYSTLKNCMITSHFLFGKISTIYMASTQSPIFRLLRIYEFATAHLRIIHELRINKLFHDCKSST
jgi:hypothetical protein